jgi:RNA polymerase sigma factor (sigma-70 family)
MVLNEYLSWRRRQRSIPTAAPTLEGAAGGYEDPVAQLIERDAMVRRIAMLPRKQRIVVVLRFYEGCSDAEIAALLGCRETTVRSHCSRALATLRATMPTAATTRPAGYSTLQTTEE